MKKTKDNFSNIIGYESIKKELRLVADIIKSPAKYEKLGAIAPSGLLLVGPPGTGKSTLAEDFIKECECETFTVRKSKASEKLVFEINSAFDKAKEVDGYSVILLDDFDKFENNDENGANADCFIALQSQMDNVKQEGKKVVVVLTANSTRGLPGSLRRRGRIDMVLRVDRPSPEDAKKIIAYYLKDKKCKGLNIDDIAKIVPAANCASLESIMNNAAILVVSANKEYITMDEINRAALREIFDAPEISEGYPKDELHRLAVHEAGHAVISEMLTPGSVRIVALTRTDGTGANAVTSIYSETGLSRIEDYENRIRSTLGGRAATEIMTGKVDTGTYSDLGKVHRYLDRLIQGACAWGFDCHGVDFDESQEIGAAREKLCATKVDKYYKDAIKILVDNRDFLEAFITELEKKIVVTRKDIDQIINKVNSKKAKTVNTKTEREGR